MARYSFYVKEKETGTGLYSKKRFPLPFLDYFALQFNGKEELMKFLGVDPEKYDDVGIVYKAEGVVKNLKLYFDSLELEEIAGSVLKLPLSHTSLLIRERMALGYVYPKMIRVNNLIPESKSTYEVIRRINIPGFAEEAHYMGLLDDKSYEYYQHDEKDKLNNHLLKHYLYLRRVLGGLYDRYYLIGSGEPPKPTPEQTMQEIAAHYSESFNMDAYKKMRLSFLTPEEEILVAKILIDSDETAYDMLKSSSPERLSDMKPILEYIEERRGNVKKIGTID